MPTLSHLCSDCILRSSRQRAYCSDLAGSGSSSSFNQNRNQSTDPPCDAMRTAGLVRRCSSVFNMIKSTGLWRERSPAYGSHIKVNVLEGPSPTTNNGPFTLSRLNPGDRFSHCCKPPPNGCAPITASNSFARPLSEYPPVNIYCTYDSICPS